MKLTARQLAHLVGGRLVGDGARAFTRLFSDSRQAPSDARQALFVALRAREVGRYDQAGLVLAVLRHAARHPLDLVRAPASG